MTPAFDKGSRVNQYLILEKVHHGGKSDIYVAEDSQNRRPVTLKIFRIDTAAPEYKTTFLSYIPKLTQFNHAGLVKIHEAFEWEGHLVLVMDFCEGQSLKDLLKDFETTPQKTAEVMLQILETIDHVHKEDMVHGPITPSHIIIGLDGRAKVIGFEEGLDYMLLSDERTATIRNPEYASPELLDGSTPDKRSDLFSLGVLMYELLAGESPFRGDDREESAELVKTHTPTALSKIRPELPHRLDNVLQRLLCKDPEHRYQNAAEVIHDLREIKFDENIAAGGKAPVDWWNRYVVPAAALVLIIIALLWLLR